MGAAAGNTRDLPGLINHFHEGWFKAIKAGHIATCKATIHQSLMANLTTDRLDGHHQPERIAAGVGRRLASAFVVRERSLRERSNQS